MLTFFRSTSPVRTRLLGLALATAVLFVLNAPSSQAAPLADNQSPTAFGDPLAGISSISAGDEHSCAVTDAGTVECWGRNTYGQLGDGTVADSGLPVTVLGLTSIMAVSAGGGHTCALTIGGGVKCWGRNTDGQLGNGSTTDSLTPVDVTGLSSGVAAVSAGLEHTCALTDAGGVKCWGSNYYVQLGDGTGEDRNTPVDVSGLATGVSAITTNGDHTCALTNGGGLKCWGDNARGQLGDDSQIGRSQPVDVMGLTSGIAAVSAGRMHTCALTIGGAVKCWGRNFEQQLGDGTSADRLTPVDVPGAASGVAHVRAGGFHTCIETTGGGVKCWGWNKDGQLGDGTNTDSSSPVDVTGLDSGVTMVSAGGSHTCALVNMGVKCWGINENGQLGNASSEASTTPVDVKEGGDPLTNVSAIGAGNAHSCAVMNNGVKCWGNNEYGQLGNGTTVTSTFAVQVGGLASDIAAVGAGDNHTCVLTGGGGVKCWGYNHLGALGNGTTTDSLTPVNVLTLDSGAAALTVGGNHNCVLTAAGGAKCWGRNSSGQLGTGNSSASTVPLSVMGLGSGVTAISAGTAHTCAVVNGGAKCWGWNYYGQLGDGSTDSSTVPLDVTGLTSGVATVVSGRWHTCALTDGGGVKCWGFNAYGQLGNDTKDDSATPVDVSGLSSGVTAIALGDRHTCALLDTGGVKCWGYNNGVLGDGASSSKSTPVDVVGLGSGVTAIRAGGLHTCVLTDAGNAKCWGRNENGQLGDGTQQDRDAPTNVIMPAANQIDTPTDTLFLPVLLTS